MKYELQELMSIVFENSPIPVLLIDEQLNIIYYNKSLSLLTFIEDKIEVLDDIFPENSPTLKYIRKSIMNYIPSLEQELFHSASRDLYFSISHNIINYKSRNSSNYHLYKFFNVSTFTRFKKSVKKYTDKILFENLTDLTEKSRLGGRFLDCSVMFLDIRGYTSFSEIENADEVLESLNHYFNSIVGIIEKKQGIINKFIGDSILAYFINPDSDSAINTALEILKKVSYINHIKGELGQKILTLGIGIHFGKVIIGNVGAFHRMDYTLLGDTVNIASRLCGIAKQNEIVITSQLYDKVLDQNIKSNIILSELIELKGKSLPLRVYRINQAI